jgi:hypothetical protein
MIVSHTLSCRTTPRVPAHCGYQTLTASLAVRTAPSSLRRTAPNTQLFSSAESCDFVASYAKRLSVRHKPSVADAVMEAQDVGVRQHSALVPRQPLPRERALALLCKHRLQREMVVCETVCWHLLKECAQQPWLRNGVKPAAVICRGPMKELRPSAMAQRLMTSSSMCCGRRAGSGCQAQLPGGHVRTWPWGPPVGVEGSTERQQGH